MLSLVLQSLKEIDRYRDSVQLKATVNSIIAAWIQRDQETSLGSSITGDGGALRKTSTITSAAGTDRVVRESEMVPGLVIEHLEAGEKIIAQPSHGTDEKFGTFEEAIIQAVAWHYEIPPEILRLSFSHNYSASQAATNEFKMTLNRWRACFASGFTQAIYEDWLVQQVLMGKVDAPGFLESLRDPLGYDTTSAWLQADWSGQIKPAVDEVKLTNAHVLRLQNGLTTYSRATREINGQKFSRVVKQLKKERALLEDAGLLLEPSAPAQQPPPAIEPERDEEDKDEEALPLVRRIA